MAAARGSFTIDLPGVPNQARVYFDAIHLCEHRGPQGDGESRHFPARSRFSASNLASASSVAISSGQP